VSFVLNLLLHLLLTSSLLIFGYFLYWTILESGDRFESLLRAGTALSALLVILGGRLAGLNVAELTVKALSDVSPLTLVASTATPGAAGIALGWYLIRRFQHSGNIAKRIMIFVGIIAVAQFILVYLETLREQGTDLSPAVIPNVAFVVGIILYVALTYEARPRTTTRETGPLRRFIR